MQTPSVPLCYLRAVNLLHHDDVFWSEPDVPWERMEWCFGLGLYMNTAVWASYAGTLTLDLYRRSSMKHRTNCKQVHKGRPTHHIAYNSRQKQHHKKHKQKNKEEPQPHTNTPRNTLFAVEKTAFSKACARNSCWIPQWFMIPRQCNPCLTGTQLRMHMCVCVFVYQIQWQPPICCWNESVCRFPQHDIDRQASHFLFCNSRLAYQCVAYGKCKRWAWDIPLVSGVNATMGSLQEFNLVLGSWLPSCNHGYGLLAGIPLGFG